jgi:hypothetical protein
MATLILEKDFQTITNERTSIEPDQRVFGEKVGILTKLFGCWHDNISRPFVDGKTAYRTCLKCGARKRFNPETLLTEGDFYYPPAVRKIEGS